eukprot:6894530-Pyramimonas_sp.AAC.1
MQGERQEVHEAEIEVLDRELLQFGSYIALDAAEVAVRWELVQRLHNLSTALKCRRTVVTLSPPALLTAGVPPCTRPLATHARSFYPYRATLESRYPPSSRRADRRSSLGMP